MISPKKRVRVYIDAANLILSARTHGIEYDIAILCEYLRYRYSATSCVYFTGRISALQADYSRIAKLGMEIVFKEIYSEHAKTKANCDVEIAHRITRDIERKKVDGIVLVSGDGDFAGLLDYIRDSGIETHLFAIHRKDTSRLLRMRSYLRTCGYVMSIPKFCKEKAPLKSKFQQSDFSLLKLYTTPCPKSINYSHPY
jgi:uncharacterized LabA/DUF88 family protein